jgi:hypothetical protein
MMSVILDAIGGERTLAQPSDSVDPDPFLPLTDGYSCAAQSAFDTTGKAALTPHQPAPDAKTVT